jgi:hypothetical protein
MLSTAASGQTDLGPLEGTGPEVALSLFAVVGDGTTSETDGSERSELGTILTGLHHSPNSTMSRNDAVNGDIVGSAQIIKVKRFFYPS